ncbi:hypothetical protein DFQ29_005228 [Apophysomyces sp. BC1021]|nr:hypothetical protein DFQ29_005228 [Apophysomyces sp. BC1021]
MFAVDESELWSAYDEIKVGGLDIFRDFGTAQVLMIILSENDVNDKRGILDKINLHAPNASEETQSPESDLLLGKAMHIVLNVREHVLDDTLQDWIEHNKSSTTHGNTQNLVLKALVSIDNYVDTQNDINGSLAHIYDPLKEKASLMCIATCIQYRQPVIHVVLKT